MWRHPRKECQMRRSVLASLILVAVANGQTITTQEKPDNYQGNDPRAAPQAK